jgi:hypothetical protein
METYDDDTMICPLCEVEIPDGEPTVEVREAHHLPYHAQRSGYGSGIYCGECLVECSSCEHFMESNDVLYDNGTGAPMCGDCWCERWQYCDNCGDTVRTEESHYDDDSGYTVCSECRPQYSRGEAMTLAKCGTCDTYNVHFHILSEKYLCDCQADTVPTAYIVRTNTLQNA